MIISAVRLHRLEYVEKENQLVPAHPAALLRENSTCWKTRQNWKYLGLGSDGSRRGILWDVLRINFQNTLINGDGIRWKCNLNMNEMKRF